MNRIQCPCGLVTAAFMAGRPCPWCSRTKDDSVEGPDVRLALSSAFKDLADQALARGDRSEHGIWMRASEMAHDFVVRPGPR